MTTITKTYLRITIDNDQDTENPCEDDGWKVKSFSTKHTNFVHPNTLFPPSLGLRRKLKCGTAFILSYYEHGSHVWSLQGQGPQCEWDSVDVAGLLVWEDEVSDLGPKTYEARRKDAESFLEDYTNWGNGNCYWYKVEKIIPPTDAEDFDLEMDHEDCETDDEDDSCGGFIGEDSVVEAIREILAEYKGEDVEFMVVGDAAWIGDYHKFT